MKAKKKAGMHMMNGRMMKDSEMPGMKAYKEGKKKAKPKK